MLHSLLIQDFILIEKLFMDFEDGLCVITGQTGAGKSILLDAMMFALGAKAGSEIVRTGQEKATAVLTFTVSEEIILYLAEYDIEAGKDEDLSIKRVQYANNRKQFFINNQIATQKLVFSLFDYLLEIHGQHNHTSLLNISSHLEILDQFAGAGGIRAETAALYKTMREVESQILSINSERENIVGEIGYLSHIYQEYEELAIKEGEEEELAEIKRLLQSRDKEIKLIESVTSSIESSNIRQIIGQAQRNLGKSENPTLYEEVHLHLEEIYNKLEETASALERVLLNFDLPASSLEEVEDRLYAIRSLARKHGCLPAELASFMQNSKERLEALAAKLKGSEDLTERAAKAKKEYIDKARTLSQLRQEAAGKLESRTMAELALLDMKKAVFSVMISSSEEKASRTGINEVRFFASTNPGLPAAPIDKIASGGELSRLMLAFRAAIFDKGNQQTLIFDEIDAGISGNVADAVGERLKDLSLVTQVIVITHQPQVAAKAQQHILIKKRQTNASTTITAETLDHEGRSRELARMISGKTITDKSLAAAEELLVE